MLEIVTVSALTAFLTAVGNGAGGEMGKQMLLSTGALARRALGRETPLPNTREGFEVLARRIHPHLSQDPRQADEWAMLVRSVPATPSALPAGPGLPPATRDFTDRQRVLKELRREATRPAAGRPRVALLHGPPGIGTTAVALHWGATRLAEFPDGRFYVDLRDAAGVDGPEPATVLLRLLRRMGVEPDQIPPREEDREALYRSLTDGLRALIVIDHVSSAAQVRSLIPSSPEVFLLVVASGPPFALEARRVAVPPLSDRDALTLLRKVAGRENMTRRTPRIPEVLDTCAGNALALRAAADQLLTGEAMPPDDGHPSARRDPVRDTVREICRRLPSETVRLCRLTALGGWPAVDARLAGAAAGVTEESAGRMLARAADARLVEPLPEGRFRFRPEVARYLAETAGAEHGVAECFAGVSRALDALSNRARHAAHAALGQSWRTEPAPEDGERYGDEESGLAALSAEVGNLVRAVSVADEYQQFTSALQLARALWPLQLKAGYWDEVLPALRIAARCADAHQPDSRTAGALHFQLAHCLGALERVEEAERHVRMATACERTAGHVRGEASSVELLGLLNLNQWQFDDAYEQFVEAERLYRTISPGQEGAEDLPRALALVRRHQGRALRGIGRHEESRLLLDAAVGFFAEHGEAYNQARALTDLAETLHAAGEHTAALTRIAEAEGLLTPAAAPHLRYLADLRSRCRSGA